MDETQISEGAQEYPARHVAFSASHVGISTTHVEYRTSHFENRARLVIGSRLSTRCYASCTAASSRLTRALAGIPHARAQARFPCMACVPKAPLPPQRGGSRSFSAHYLVEANASPPALRVCSLWKEIALCFHLSTPRKSMLYLSSWKPWRRKVQSIGGTRACARSLDQPF